MLSTASESVNPVLDYTMVSYATMCSMLHHRGVELSETQLKEQWNYLKAAGSGEDHTTNTLCIHGCGQQVTSRKKKFLSQEAQDELLKRSCYSPCWMNAHFPQEYIRVGWNRRGLDHGGGCLQALLKRGAEALEAGNWQHLDSWRDEA